MKKWVLNIFCGMAACFLNGFRKFYQSNPFPFGIPKQIPSIKIPPGTGWNCMEWMP
jgi:hypothetical protein